MQGRSDQLGDSDREVQAARLLQPPCQINPEECKDSADAETGFGVPTAGRGAEGERRSAPRLSRGSVDDHLDIVPVEIWNVEEKKRRASEIMLDGNCCKALPGELPETAPAQNAQRTDAIIPRFKSEKSLDRQRAP